MSRQSRGQRIPDASKDKDADHISVRRAQWADAMPDVATDGMGILGRARWVVQQSRPAIEATFADHGLDTGTFDVVATLLRSGPPYRLRPTELYRKLMISSGGMTDRLARLERAGLITRPPSASDARSLEVQLTDEGRSRAEDAFRADMAIESAMLTGLTTGDREQLETMLTKLASCVVAFSKTHEKGN